ncbi:transcription factor bHLH18-like [Chenopodium quinoa]|uniref:transcription factor bHLH18-like n=1 Tax=Chenopodium quinoa TaxID=63459 RepID=UPI000B78EDCA|nr:transcription factor bHLH18-like [Chenopodium quinoa]
MTPMEAWLAELTQVDKITVLTETIKYVKQLQEKVKVLEEKADEKKVIESMVVMVRAHKITVDNDNDNDSSSAMGDNCADGSGGCNSNIGDSNNDEKDTINLSSLPEIEVKKLGETLLVKVCCAKQKWTLPKLYAELYKHDISITYSNVTPFERLAIITIVAQMGRNFNKNVKDFVKTLCTTLREPVRDG